MLIEFRAYDGAVLVGEATGEPDAPAVLMLHDGGAARDLWSGTARALAAAGRHAVNLDLGGRQAVGRGGLDTLAGDVRSALEAMGSRPVVAATSMIGLAAIAALGEGGEHLATGLVLVEAPPAERTGEPLTSGSRITDAAAGIRAPTLLVRGSGGDPTFREIVDAIPDLTCVDADRPEEVAAADWADAFNALLLDFLESVAPRAASEYRAGSDPRTLRDALGCFGTGVTVVTTLGPGGEPIGLTANSFTSVSLEPPLLLVCLARTSKSLPAFAAADAFAINVLHTGQQAVSGRFASRTEDRFSATPWESWDTGAPIIRHSLASFDCAKFAWHEAGDHVILVGRVQRVRFEPRRDPLLYFRGRYRRLHFS